MGAFFWYADVPTWNLALLSDWFLCDLRKALGQSVVPPPCTIIFLCSSHLLLESDEALLSYQVLAIGFEISLTSCVSVILF